MDWTAIIIAALTSSGLTSFVGWRIRKKQGEIETVKKLVDDVYKPLIEEQNKQIAELRQEVNSLYDDVKRLRSERDECKAALASIRSQVEGLAEGRPSRDNKTGRYAPRRKRDEAGS